MYPGFEKDILAFNAMYKLEPIPAGTYEALDQLVNFEDILEEELKECEPLVEKFGDMLAMSPHKGVPDVEDARLDDEQWLDVRTELADWLGDVIVYCATMAARWRLPMAAVLETIMKSNFSKLGADGKPIYDARGKVQKGPGYWKPEPTIRGILSVADVKPFGGANE